jgi:hypothetical protein
VPPSRPAWRPAERTLAAGNKTPLDSGLTLRHSGWMRLSIMERGHTPEQKQAFARVEADSGVATPDAVLSLTYRCEFFGTPYSDLLHEVMRGPSDWSVGDRELFAAFVSSENQCPY